MLTSIEVVFYFCDYDFMINVPSDSSSESRSPPSGLPTCFEDSVAESSPKADMIIPLSPPDLSSITPEPDSSIADDLDKMSKLDNLARLAEVGVKREVFRTLASIAGMHLVATIIQKFARGFLARRFVVAVKAHLGMKMAASYIQAAIRQRLAAKKGRSSLKPGL
jgi:hypothetical protein